MLLRRSAAWLVRARFPAKRRRSPTRPQLWRALFPSIPPQYFGNTVRWYEATERPNRAHGNTADCRKVSVFCAPNRTDLVDMTPPRATLHRKGERQMPKFMLQASYTSEG